MRPIDADALEKEICNLCKIQEKCLGSPYKCGPIETLHKQPTIEADRPAREEPEPARWLHRKRNGYAVLVCSACEKQKEGYTRTAYCPHCGRPMTGEGEQE